MKKINKETQKVIMVVGAAILLVALSFYIGSLTTEVKFLRNGLGGTAGTGLPTGTGTEPTAEPGDVDPLTDTDHVRGNRNARVALIEYSDYECPFCQQFHPTAQQAMAEYGDELMWIYRHFPLESIHPNARGAAIAAECVAELGGNDAFWSYTDALFSSTSLTQTALIQTASDAGFNISDCVEEARTDSLVDAGIESGIRANVTGTPGNFVMNLETGDVIMLGGAVPYAQLSAAIDEMLSK